MAIVTRSGLGRALTWAEEDTNFTELDTRTAETWANMNGIVVVPSSSPPAYGLYKGIQLLMFDAAALQQVSVLFHIPKDFIPGSDIYLHSHVVSETASSGVVRWGFTYTHAGDNHGEAPTSNQYFTAPTTVYVENTKTAADLDLHRVAETPGLSIPELLPDDVILVNFFRDGAHVNDTYPDAVFLLYVDIYYRTQGFGAVNR